LGITIIGGLMLSQLITLYTTPVIYLIFDDFARKFSSSEPLEAEQQHSGQIPVGEQA
jgi:hypothetical protein